MRTDVADADRVAVGRRAHDPADGDAASRTRNVLYHHGLAERTRQAPGHDPRDRVRGPARGKWHDHGDGMRRVALCSGRKGTSQNSMKTVSYTHLTLPTNRE